MRVVFSPVLVVALVLGVALGSPARAGDVTAVLAGTSLVLSSAGGDAQIAIVGLDADSLQVTPTAPTTLNGAGAAITFDGVTGNLSFDLGAGANTVQLLNATVVGGTQSFALGGGTNTGP